MVPAGWVWALLLWLSASPLAADEWSVYRAQDVVFQFQASDSVLARVVLDDVLEGRKEIAKKFGGVPEVGMTVYLAPSESVFRELTQGRIPHWGVGCAFLMPVLWCCGNCRAMWIFCCVRPGMRWPIFCCTKVCRGKCRSGLTKA